MGLFGTEARAAYSCPRTREMIIVSEEGMTEEVVLRVMGIIIHCGCWSGTECEEPCEVNQLTKAEEFLEIQRKLFGESQ